MDKLDRLVTEHLSERLFQPERLAAILASLSSRRAIKEQSVNSRLMALQKQVADADEKLKRLYHLVEKGVTDLDDILKDRLNALKAERDRAIAALERAKEQSANILSEPETGPNGMLYRVEDIEGRRWMFMQRLVV